MMGPSSSSLQVSRVKCCFYILHAFPCYLLLRCMDLTFFHSASVLFFTSLPFCLGLPTQNYCDDPQMKGIIPRVVEQIFNCVNEAESDIEFSIKVSYVEIYME